MKPHIKPHVKRSFVATAVAAGAMGIAVLMATGIVGPQAASANLNVGESAPDFVLTDSHGETHALSDYRGRTVILEWTNHDCPYVRKHYGGDNMQALQKEYTDQGAVWLTVISSKPGAQGYVEPEKANELTETRDAHPSAVLLDPAGDVGRAYGAKTTPHMYIVDTEGTLRYQGAIDDKPSARPASLEGATNYVRAAMADLEAGRPVQTAETTAYGCSVKY